MRDRSRNALCDGIGRGLRLDPTLFRFALAALILFVLPGLPVMAQTDEIQVYNAEIAAPGVFNLTLHDNYTPDGRTVPAFPGGPVPNDTLNGVPEWAYGVTDWFEAGLYLPLYSISSNEGAVLNGFKLRALFVSPDAADRSFFYGINFEFSYNARHWDPNRYTSEIRPILGWRFGPVDLIFNPILDNSYQGVSRLDFAPATRLAYNFSKEWAVAAEEYDDFGPLRGFLPVSQQSHQLFAVADWSGEAVSVEGGIGFGLTSATDHVVLKLILSKDLN
ncbi:MAG TPA: hypothetical protein VNX86_10930 [Rhizomicrobium sp.]|nr:hypothetical protein [Rhizomicrobium sp.]